MSRNLEEIRREIDEADREIAEQFFRRMRAVEEIAAYKRERGLPIFDAAREEEVLRRNCERIRDDDLRASYAAFQKNVMELSRAYQRRLIPECDTDGGTNRRTIPIRLGERGYDVVIERGILSRAGEELNLQRKVLILTDDGVPADYAKAVAQAAKEATVLTVRAGEASKSMDGFSAVLEAMFRAGLTRGDCIVAVGGGVCGDLAGFAASAYLRGIDFYNIPTTLLAQVDSSVGGKTAINFAGVKNPVGAFYQPKKVLIDPDVLRTLDRRQLLSGLAEAIKMAFCFDERLFRLLETEPFEEHLEEIIAGSILIKRRVIEADEREAGPRKLLNFGHTLGHGIESTAEPPLCHGECVALGMLPMCEGGAQERLRRVLERVGLPTAFRPDADAVLAAAEHDKKQTSDGTDCVLVREVGKATVVRLTVQDLRDRLTRTYPC